MIAQEDDAIELFRREKNENRCYRLSYQQKAIEKQILCSEKFRFKQGTRALYLPHNNIFFAGGISRNNEKTASFSLYHRNQATFFLRSWMEQERAHFGCIYFNNKIYVIGGNSEPKKFRLTKCEVNDCRKNIWQSIADLPMSLRKIQCFEYNNFVHIIGIERKDNYEYLRIYQLSQNEGNWIRIGKETCHAKKHQYQNIFLLNSLYANELCVLIVTYTAYPLDCRLLRIDLINEDIIADKTFSFADVGEDDFIFTKGYTVNILTYKKGMGLKELFWIRHDIRSNSRETIKIFEGNGIDIENGFIVPVVNPTVPYVNPGKRYGPRNFSDKHILFGDSIEPYQFEFDWTNKQVQVYPVPFGFYSKNGSFCRVEKDKFFFASPTFKSFMYDLSKRKISYFSKLMNYTNPNTEVKCDFNLIYSSGDVYLIGGKNTNCFRFNIQQKKWFDIGSLPRSRIKPLLLLYKEDLFVISIDKKDSKSKRIYKYSLSKKKWNTLERDFMFFLNITKYIGVGDRFFFFNKSNDFINVVDFFFSMETKNCAENAYENGNRTECNHFKYHKGKDNNISVQVKRGSDRFYFEFVSNNQEHKQFQHSIYEEFQQKLLSAFKN